MKFGYIKESFSKKKKPLVFISIWISLEFYLFLMPREILYSDQEWVKWIMIFGVIFFGIPFFLYKSFHTIISPKWIATCAAMASPLINGPAFGTFLGGKEIIALKENGAWITGQVIDKKFVSMPKRTDYWAIQSEYKINGKTYQTSWEHIEETKYKIGDEVNIIYLQDFPEIYRIEDEWGDSN